GLHLSHCFRRYGPHRALHSFPTRRSSDLILPIRQPVRLSSRKANNLVRSPNCAMTVQPPVAAGFSPVAGRRKATRWHAVITPIRDRKSTRLNSSHVSISYAVFCLKKKNKS